MKNYTVNFYEIGDSFTKVLGFEEVYWTEDKQEAQEEFEERKKYITSENNLGVTFSTWENDIEIEQEDYSSDTIKNEEQVEKIMNLIDWQ